MSVKRIYQDRYPYFVTTNIRGGEPFFDKEKFALTAYNLLIEAENKYNFELFAFCIMPNHMHILLKTSPENNLSQLIQKYKSFVYKQWRVQFNFKCKVWQKSFDYKIKDDLYALENSLIYIKNNPIQLKLPDKYKSTPYLYFNSEKIKDLRAQKW